jgi:sugar/nucleoside kinase (ribokinase family)
MLHLASLEPVDYLIIGHLTKDLTSTGPMLGGTAAYASLTAKALGMRVGIVTAMASDLPLNQLQGIQIAAYQSDVSTTFENIYTHEGRVQKLYAVAPNLGYHLVPEPWRQAPIVHLGPVAQEVEPALARSFPEALVGITPQGWLRNWDANGQVQASEWPEARFVLENASAVVMSIEDVQSDETRIEEMVSSSRVLVVTEGSAGARLYWNGDLRRFRPPQIEETDPVGAGDIFATAFFIRLYQTNDPWEAARFATLLAANSVTRIGLRGVPTEEEVRASLVEII